MANMTPGQALRYLERRMIDAPATDEQTVTDGLAFDALWDLVLKGPKMLQRNYQERD